MSTVYELERSIVGMLKHDEGFSETPYIGSQGFWHIGFGFCLVPTKVPKMPEKVAQVWLVEIIKELSAQLADSHRGHIYRELNTDIKCAVLNMCYQMGVEGCLEFKNMWDCLERDDYEGAADQALDSLWARKQTPIRAERIATVIRTGTLDGYQER